LASIVAKSGPSNTSRLAICVSLSTVGHGLVIASGRTPLHVPLASQVRTPSEAIAKFEEPAISPVGPMQLFGVTTFLASMFAFMMVL
jgi:hypothetical protein